MKSRKMRQTEHLACIGGKEDAFTILVGKPEGRSPLGNQDEDG
jgi:hypothetical protein